MRSASIKLFAEELPCLGILEGWRLFSGEFAYHLTATAIPEFWKMTEDDAIALGRAASIIAGRFREAAERDTTIKTGSVLTRKSGDELIIDVGIYDDNAISFQFFTLPPVRLPGDQRVALLRAFARFGSDVSAIGAPSSTGIAGAPSAAVDLRWKGD